MGYDLHITRKENWFDEDKQLDITIEEWHLLVAYDAEIEIDTTDKIYTTEGERCLYKWTAILPNNEDSIWFDLCDGNIVAKYPNEDTIKKMCSIALELNAKVQGDDGEVYQIIDGCVVSTDL